MRTERFLRCRTTTLDDRERQRLEAAISEVRTIGKRRTVIRHGAPLDISLYLVRGYMCRTIDNNQGDRQLVSIQVPGDFVDLHGYPLRVLDHDVSTLTEAEIAVVPHANLDTLVAEEPALARKLWFSTLLDAAIHRQWILKMEELTAARRVAHVFAELWHRLDMVGLGRRDGLRTPLIQADLADMCGTTSIHMNRALGQLRKEGIAEFRRGAVYVRDRSRLEAFAGFNPDYLYGRGDLGVGTELAAPAPAR